MRNMKLYLLIQGALELCVAHNEFRILSGGVVKIFFRFAMAAMLLASCPGVFADGKIYPTETAVEITGTVAQGKGYDANDKREDYYYLKLAHPISVAGDEADLKQKDGVVKIQMVFLADVDKRTYYRKKVVVRGKLFHGYTAHHHTDILIQIENPSDIRLK